MVKRNQASNQADLEADAGGSESLGLDELLAGYVRPKEVPLEQWLGGGGDLAGWMNQTTWEGESHDWNLGDGRHIRESGRYQPVGGGAVAVRRSVEFTLDGDAGAPAVRVLTEVRAGVIEVVDVQFSASPSEGRIRAEHLRSIDMEEFVNYHASTGFRVSPDGRKVQTVAALTDDVRDDAVATVLRSRPKRRITKAFLHQVAGVYRDNPKTPTKAVAERFFVSPRQASAYVTEARRAGILPMTTRGKKQA